MDVSIEKYEAIVRYMKSYDYENLPTLAFTKEDAEYLQKACEKQIPKKPVISRWTTAKCPSCGGELGEDLEDGYVKNWTSQKVCDCGQLIKWNDEEWE